jgi:hypothetical protein
MKYSDCNISPEKNAFIAYNLGVYQTVQKFGDLIIKGKITSNMDFKDGQSSCKFIFIL